MVEGLAGRHLWLQGDLEGLTFKLGTSSLVLFGHKTGINKYKHTHI